MKYLIIIWLILGIHSAWYFIKKYRSYDDFTTKNIPEIIICIILPIITHIATYAVYGNKKTLFKRRENE